MTIEVTLQTRTFLRRKGDSIDNYAQDCLGKTEMYPYFWPKYRYQVPNITLRTNQLWSVPGWFHWKPKLLVIWSYGGRNLLGKFTMKGNLGTNPKISLLRIQSIPISLPPSPSADHRHRRPSPRLLRSSPKCFPTPVWPSSNQFSRYQTAIFLKPKSGSVLGTGNPAGWASHGPASKYLPSSSQAPWHTSKHK